MRRLSGLIWIALAMLLSNVASAGAQQQVHLKIIAFNDFHGNLESPGSFQAGPQSPAVPVGGADYFAGYIAALKRENPLNVVVSAGDLTGASPLVSALSHDDDTIKAMNMIGLDINGVGNHEFDGGLKELLRKQHGGCWSENSAGGCKGKAGDAFAVFRGAKFEYLAANVYDTATGKTIFPAYATRTYGGVKIGFIGLTLEDTPTIAVASAVKGLRFTDEAAAINTNVERLHRLGVHSIVVLVHQGGYQKGDGAVDINGCAGGLAGSPIESIVKQLNDGVDLVLSAHTHEPYVCEMANRSGRNIPVTSASSYGRVITDIDMTLAAKSGRVVKIAAKNVLVDRTNLDVQPDAAVKALVDKAAQRAAPLVNRVVGSVGGEITKTEHASGESEMGEMIADAELEATHAAADGGAVMAFTNIGGVRAGFAYDAQSKGSVTYGKMLTALPFGNDLITMTLTGAQVKTLLEQQFKGCGAGDASSEDVPITQRWLEVSAGFSYSWRESGAVCDKVDASSIRVDGAAIDPAGKYRLTVNDLLAGGGEQVPVLKLGTDRHIGVKDIEAMEMYLGKHPGVKGSPTTRIKIVP